MELKIYKMEKKFKIPRKLKKKLKKTIWLYPSVNGGSLMAEPATNQKDFLAWKKGEIRDILENIHSKKHRQEYKEKMNKEIYVEDEVLKEYVDEIFAEKYRYNSLETLLKVKEKEHLRIYYFQFINAYNLYKAGQDSYSNTCCQVVDFAKENLKK